MKQDRFDRAINRIRKIGEKLKAADKLQPHKDGPHHIEVHRWIKELKDIVGETVSELEKSGADPSMKDELLQAARSASEEAPARRSDPLPPPGDQE